MCRLYGFRSTEPTRVECTLVHSQNALMVQSRTDSTGRSHGHGWGIAVYEDHLPEVSREAWDAYQNEAFRDAAARVYARTVVAHVRRATVGVAAIENTHPFADGSWSMAHNGTIPNFDAVRAKMLDHMSDRHRRAILGDTDSEAFFRLFLSRLGESGATPESALSAAATQVIAWCRSEDASARIGLNVIATNGCDLLGIRWGRSLFFVERRGVTDCEICRYPHIRTPAAGEYRALVVASEPLTHGESWLEVPEGSMFSASGRCELRMRSLGLEPEPPRPSPEVSGELALRTTLVEEFMLDHRALAEGLRRLIGAIEAGHVDDVRREAERIDAVSGAHIAFEERDLYPAIGADPSMYEDHNEGRAMLDAALELHTSVAPSRRRELVAAAEAMLEHMEDCGVLLGRVRTLAPIEQSKLEDRLLAWRENAPRWTELSLAHHT